MSTAFEKELILFLSMQKLYLKISRRRKGRWGIDVGSILIFTNKAIISEGKDNDHLFGKKKRKKAQPSTAVLNTGFALFLKVLV